MRTTIFKKLTLVIVIAAAVSTTTFGQRCNNASRFANNQATFTQPTCINQITDLTDKQVTQIQDLENKHQTEMDKLRTQRRSTIDVTEKDKVRAEMDKKVLAHQSEVKSLLTEDQQKQYELLHTSANPNYAQGRQYYRGGAGNRQSFRGAGRGYNRGGGQGNLATANNGRFNRGGAHHRGYGRNAGFGRGYGQGLQNTPTEKTEEPTEN
ncbi:MAG: hypothetical protein L3J54_11435 [Draconibacterium sp.]|nr:hypothetical protein [Draconibacterium sp.]